MFDYIDDEAALERLCTRLSAEGWLGLDTEFVRERTYYPRLCLLQLSTRDGFVACIDTLALAGLDALLDVMWRDDTTRVLHSGSQDLELLHAVRGNLPPDVFDTQVAAALVGFDAQAGYGALVQTRLGIALPKSHTRSDWSKRPLSRAELDYAADDVRHLPALYDDLCEELNARGRLEWAREESAALADPARYTPDPEEAWSRVKGRRNLDAAGLAALHGLAAWRERMAMQHDRPRQWIVRDEVLVALARLQPADERALAAIEGMPPAVARKYPDALLEIIATVPAQVVQAERAYRPLDRDERARMEKMMRLVRERSQEVEISPSMLATRSDCEALLRGERDLELLRGWRRQLIGDDLLELSAAA